MLTVNPCDGVDKPKVPRYEIQPLTEEQVRAFLEEAKSDKFYALFVLAVTTGMRQGELLGLQWRDLDLDNGFVSIKQTLIPNSLILREPKTKTSRRRISLSKRAVTALEEHKKTQDAEKANKKDWDKSLDLVFPTVNGRPMRKQNLVRRHFDKVLKKAGLPKIRFHDLRHTAASLLLEAGEHPKIVQEMLGHSTIAMTLDTYSHVTPNLQAQAAKKMEYLLGDKDDSSNLKEISSYYKSKPSTHKVISLLPLRNVQ